MSLPSSGAPSELCQSYPTSSGGKGHSKGHQRCVLKKQAEQGSVRRGGLDICSFL